MSAPQRYDAELVAEKAEAYARMRDHIERLAPHSFDEGTGHVLDELVDAWARHWTFQVENQHLDGQTIVDRMVGDVVSLEVHRRYLREAAELELEGLRQAVVTARQRLHGGDRTRDDGSRA